MTFLKLKWNKFTSKFVLTKKNWLKGNFVMEIACLNLNSFKLGNIFFVSKTFITCLVVIINIIKTTKTNLVLKVNFSFPSGFMTCLQHYNQKPSYQLLVVKSENWWSSCFAIIMNQLISDIAVFLFRLAIVQQIFSCRNPVLDRA